MERYKSIFWKMIAFLLVLILIELLLDKLTVPSYLVPKPSEVGQYIIQNMGYLSRNTGITIFEAFVGFILGNGIAYLMALIFIQYPALEKNGMALAVAVKSMPIVALAPLFVIWFGNGITGKCLMAGLVCYFPMLVNALHGLRSTETDLVTYLESLGASKSRILVTLRIPSSMNYVFPALKTSSTVSIVGAIIAELSGADLGIGHILQVSIYQIQTEIMFAAIAFVTLASLLFYFSIEKIEHIVLGKMRLQSVA